MYGFPYAQGLIFISWLVDDWSLRCDSSALNLHAWLPIGAGVYVPPRIAAVHYDDTATNKRKKKEDREARKMRDSELYRYGWLGGWGRVTKRWIHMYQSRNRSY
jgi:hypothetical protein